MDAAHQLAIFTEIDEEGEAIAHYLIHRQSGNTSFFKLFEIPGDMVEEFVEIVTSADWEFNIN